MVKRIVIKITTFHEPVPGECVTCGFESLIRIRAYNLTESGVSTLADVTRCGRDCRDD